MIKLALTCFLLLCITPLANAIEINYTESNEDISNPDRGFYYPYTTTTSDFTALNLADLVSRRNVAYEPFIANYTVKSSIALRHYVMDSYRGTDSLENSFLNAIQTDFDTARAAGVRLIVRFSYNTSPISGDCSAGFICPPYLDAPKSRVLSHIAQLSSVLSANSDVLMGLQHGFIGMWGETYYSDYFGDASPNANLGRLTDQNWNDRNEVIAALLAAVPNNRMVQLRYAQSKQRFLDGPRAPLTEEALARVSITNEQAFNQTDGSRLGLHNDCYLASADDFGTFADYGNDTGLFSSNALSLLKKHHQNDSTYTLIGGETCFDSPSFTANNCESDSSNPGNAISEMENSHYTYLNSDYNNEVNNDWVTGGCMDEIKRRLGYRLVLKTLTASNISSVDKAFNITLSIENVGFAAPINPRQLWLILRHQTTLQEHRFLLTGENTNPQKWLAGTVNTVNASTVLSNLDTGNYSLLLHIADPSDGNRILNRPEFSIQLANLNIWESKTGFNNLNATIAVNKNDDDFDILQILPAIISASKE